MRIELDKMSEAELEKLIADAEKALNAKRDSMRKEVMAQIKELASSIGVSVQYNESSSKSPIKGSKVPPKYRNPNVKDQTWSGRGMKPKWLQELLEKGHKIEEFKI